MIEWLQIIGVLALCAILAFFLTNYLVKAKKTASENVRKRMESEKIAPPENRAGFGIRAIAFVIDLIIFSCALYLMNIAVNSQDQILNAVVFLAGWCVYYAVLVTGFGNTVGKKLLKLRIVSATTKPLTIARIALRAFFLITVDWILLGAGFWVILINKNKQGFHDEVAKTYVVRVEEK